MENNMWTEIPKNDLALIQDFAQVQSRCSEYYEQSMNARRLLVIYNRPTNEKMRAFIYRDPDYQINLCVGMTNKSTLQLKTIGLGDFKQLDGAKEIVMEKVKVLMDEYQATDIYAIWGNDPKKDVFDFYNMIGNAFNSVSFKETQLLSPRENVFSVKSKKL